MLRSLTLRNARRCEAKSWDLVSVHEGDSGTAARDVSQHFCCEIADIAKLRAAFPGLRIFSLNTDAPLILREGAFVPIEHKEIYANEETDQPGAQPGADVPTQTLNPWE